MQPVEQSIKRKEGKEQSRLPIRSFSRVALTHSMNITSRKRIAFTEMNGAAKCSGEVRRR